MTKNKSLTELLEAVKRSERDEVNARRELEKTLKVQGREVVRAVSNVFNQIFNGDDAKYAESAGDFGEVLVRAYDAGVLKARINGLSKYLEQGRNYRERKRKETELRGELRVGNEAAEYMQARYREGKESYSVSACYQSLNRAIDNGEIEARKVSERARIVKTADIDRHFGFKSGKIATGDGQTNSQRYAEMRREGMSREDIIESGKIRVPSSKNRAKYFAAMESAFSRLG